MSGTTLRILKRTTIEAGTNVVQSVSSSETPVMTNINVAGYRFAILVLRLHSVTWGGGANTTVTFRLRNSAPTDEDPAQTFRVLSAGAVISADIKNAGAAGPTNQGAVAPYVTVVASSADFGTHLDLTMQLTQGPTANANNVLSVSADLALKS